LSRLAKGFDYRVGSDQRGVLRPKDGNNDTRVVVSNPNAETARVQFRLKSGAKSLEATRTLASGAQLDTTIGELFGRDRPLQLVAATVTGLWPIIG
jgi:hypothetical protein